MASKSRFAKRFVSVATLGFATVAAVVALSLLAKPVLAQNGFGFGSRNSMFDSFFGGFSGPRYSAPAERPADFTRAPPPRKLENPPSPSVLVLGDSMADWLAYGLEDALGDTPDLAVVRKNRAASGLIHYDTRNETLDWPHVAREAIAATKPKFVVVMIGLNDRQTIHERGPSAGGTPSTPGATAAPPLVPQDNAPDVERGRRSSNAANDAKSKKDGTLNSYEFRTEEWAEAYSKKIDAMIAALRSGGVPVFWVGLPSIRGSKSTSDMLYLNDLYRTRAEKAGITYIDVWDGFVDDNGRFTIHGPDFEGQTRRLRVSDGVHFTKSGARKLAHYLEREIRRVMTPGAEVVALPASEPQTPAPSAAPGAASARPLAGPVLPLTVSYAGAQDLLGATDDAQATPTSRRVARVLVKGEAVSPPAGRSDDFKWPRRGIAPFGTDPVVATTTDPIPVMQPPKETTVAAPTDKTTAASTIGSSRKSAGRGRAETQKRGSSRRSRAPFFE